jgi:hypothetical protein
MPLSATLAWRQIGGYRAMAATGDCRHTYPFFRTASSLPSTGCVPITSRAVPGRARNSRCPRRPASRPRHRARQRPNTVELCFSTQFRVVPPVMTCVNSSTRAPRTSPRSDLAPRPAMIYKAPPSAMGRQEVSWRRDVGDPAGAIGPKERSPVTTRPCSVAGQAPQRIWPYIARCDAVRRRRCS